VTSPNNSLDSSVHPPPIRPVARDVVTFGEALVLFLAEPGVPLGAAISYRRSVTGAELNLAVGLSRLGHRTGWFGRVGNDAHGHLIRRLLKSEDVDTSRIMTDDEAPTGLIVRDCHPGRPIDVCYARKGSAGSRLGPDDLDLSYLSDCRVLSVTGVTALRGAPVGQALKEAAVVGALDVAVAGDIEGLPTVEERDRFLAGSGLVRR
jgi:2-dehydro-3-deoxygluconokinase